MTDIDPELWILVHGGPLETARQPNLPPAVAEYLVSRENLEHLDDLQDVFQRVQEAVALNPTTPAGVLESLSADPDQDIRRSVAKNPATPPAVLRKLSRDEDWYTREAVARNPATPVAVLRVLAGSDDWRVREGVVGNPSTPIATVRQAAKAALRERQDA